MNRTITERRSLKPYGAWTDIGAHQPGVSFAHVGAAEGGRGGRNYRRFAIARDGKAYVLPLWSMVTENVESKDGYTWFMWSPTREGTQTIPDAHGVQFVVIFAPDGSVKEYTGHETGVIGGKQYIIGYDEADTSVSRLIWNGKVGPALAEIRYVADGKGTPIYLGRRKDSMHWTESTKVVIRHPDEVLYEGRGDIITPFSKTREAKPVRSTVFHCGPELIEVAGKSVVWAVEPEKEGEPTTVYQDGKKIFIGDLVAFHERGSRNPVIVSRTSGDGRAYQRLGI